MNITKTLFNNEVTDAIEQATRPDRGGDWARKYLSEEAVREFMSLSEDERVDALRDLDAAPYEVHVIMRDMCR